jgi:hypothetical protein
MPLITTITPAPTIELAHHRTHEGNHYGTQHIFDIAVGSFRDFLFITPPRSQAEIHLIFEFYTEFKSRLDIYEDVNVINNGTQILSKNYNRYGTAIHLASVYVDPTLVPGEPIAIKKLFSYQRGSLTEPAILGRFERNEEEIILLGQINYLFRVTPDPALPVANIYATSEFNWYDARPSTVS